MKKYTHIIDKVIKSKKTQDNVRKMIPHMIHWAQNGQTDKTYRDLIHALGYNRWSGIGWALGSVEDVMQELRDASGENIPTLNALCQNSQTKLPSYGLEYVYPSYSKMTLVEKRKFIKGINQEAVEYEHWDEVLDALGIEPVKGLSEDEWKEILKPVHGTGGEGKAHKELKEYVKANPHVLGLKNVEVAETEYSLPSGDKLDIYFVLKDGSRIAVEIKPSTSPDSDVSRGIFQCVKYEATMNAMRKLDCKKYPVRALLVVGSEISSLNKTVADQLKVQIHVVKIEQ